MTRDAASDDWGLLVALRDPDGCEHRMIISRAMMAGDGTEVRKLLASKALWLSSRKEARERLLTLLMGLRTPRRARSVRSIGWDGDCFVLPTQTIGKTGGELHVWKGKGGTYHGEKGDLETWKTQVAAPVAGSPLAVFCLAMAFSAPLLVRTEDESSGVHVVGNSRSGKSTLLALAGSVWGGGGPRGYSQSWNSTPAALEGMASAHSGTLLSMDELGELDPSKAGTAFYGLAGGMTKNRLATDTEFRERPTWTLQILSCGEETLSELMASAKMKVRAGQEMRMLQLPADAGEGLGCWSALPDGFDDPAAFSEAIKILAKQNYGFAGPAFLKAYLADEPKWLARFRELRAAWLDEVLLPGDHGQTRNAASRMGHIVAAGELACLMGILPWQAGTVGAAARVQFERWVSEFGREMVREEKNALAHLRGWLANWEGSGFFPLKNPNASEEDALRDQYERETADKPRADEARSLKTYGFVTNYEGVGRTFLFSPETWKEVLTGFNALQTARKLKELGFLVTDAQEGRLTKKQRVRGEKNPRNFYAVAATVLQAGD